MTSTKTRLSLMPRLSATQKQRLKTRIANANVAECLLVGPACTAYGQRAHHISSASPSLSNPAAPRHNYCAETSRAALDSLLDEPGLTESMVTAWIAQCETTGQLYGFSPEALDCLIEQRGISVDTLRRASKAEKVKALASGNKQALQRWQAQCPQGSLFIV